MQLKSDLECVMINIFVDIESAKYVKSVRERKSSRYKFLSIYRKKMCRSDDCIEVDNRDEFGTII